MQMAVAPLCGARVGGTLWAGPQRGWRVTGGCVAGCTQVLYRSADVTMWLEWWAGRGCHENALTLSLILTCPRLCSPPPLLCTLSPPPSVLAQNRYFEDPAFLRYLSYLSYWRRPEYARFLTHPSCLYFLGALRHPRFRAAIAHDDYMALVHAQQGFAWQFGGGGRAAAAGSTARAFEGEGESMGGGAAPPAPGG